jgi:hypothetical protein
MLRVCEASHRVAAAAGAEVHVAEGTCSLQDRGSSGCEHVTVRSIVAASQLHSEMLLSSSFATKTVSGRSGCHTKCLQRCFRCALEIGSMWGKMDSNLGPAPDPIMQEEAN